jgi:predicted Zn-dependent protease
LNAYETIFEGRLSKYELDADHIGLFYTARGGYDPKALLILLQRLKHSKTTSSNEHYTYHQVEQRLKGINTALTAIPSTSKYFRFPERWRQNTGGLK